MPVWNTSCEVLKVVKAGAGRCMAQVSSASSIWALLVYRLAEHVHHASEDCLTDRHRDGPSGVMDLQTAPHAVRRAHRDRPHRIVADDLLDLQRHRVLLAIPGLERRGKRIVDLGDLVRLEADVYHNPLDLEQLAYATPSLLPRFFLGLSLLTTVGLSVPFPVTGAVLYLLLPGSLLLFRDALERLVGLSEC